jgi:competence protein ComEA
MDRTPEWRAVEPAPTGEAANAPPTTEAPSPAVWRIVALGALAMAALAGGALVLSTATPTSGLSLDRGPEPALTAEPEPSATTEADLLVDVQGAIMLPGLYRLAAGSRVGDAIDAAGGYGPSIDLEQAALRLNLAERLADGAKVHVPRRGEQPLAGLPSPAGASTGPSGGLIDVNSADQEALESLPGIGPVTAGKIIAARAEAPFVTVDDLLARKVVGAATLDKIRSLVSIGP